MRTMSWCSFVLALVQTGCGADDGGPTADAAAADAVPVPMSDATPPLGNVPGKYVHDITVDGLTRELIVYVPALAAGTTPVPAVFMFHGTSGDGDKFYNISGWKEKADAEGLIAVFPSALTYCFHEDENRDGDFDDPGEQKVTTKWQNGSLGIPDERPLCTAQEIAMLSPANQALVDHPLVDDLVFVDAMLDFLAASYVVDAQRVYASGFSNGGSFTSRLALERADRFAAIAAAAGALAPTPMPASRALSLVFSIGALDDGAVAVFGGPIPLDESVVQNTVFKAQFVTPMLTTLQLADVYAYTAQMLAGKQVLRWAYTTSTVGASNAFHVVLIEDLSHAYPNGTNHPIEIVDPLWTFFSGYALP